MESSSLHCSHSNNQQQLRIQGYTNMNLLFCLPLSLVAFLHSSPSSAFSPSRHHPTKALNNKLSNKNMKLGYRKPSTDLYSTTLNDIVSSSSSSESRLLSRLLFLPLALSAFLRSQQTTAVFAAIGGLTSLFSCIVIGKLLLALKKKTNFASAILSTPPRDAFADKVVLITGASSGIVSFLLQCLYVVRYPTFTSNLCNSIPN